MPVFYPSILALLIPFIRKKEVWGLFLSNIILFLSLGLFVTKFRMDNLSPIFLKDPIVSKVKGHIAEIKYTERGANITLENVLFSELLMQDSYPKKVRVSIREEDASKIQIHDYIEILAFLANSSGAIIPGGYDFGIISFFKNIGASGYGMSSLEVIERNQSSLISDVKAFLYYRLNNYMGKNEGNFAAALFLGEQGGINRQIIKNMRLAGVSHILCVSGLHISLVAGIFYLYSRMLLNFSNYIAWHWNIKKIGAIAGILGSFFYLLLTGYGIASVRAFIMSSLVLIGVVFDRITLSIRSVCFAAFVILSFNPEYIIFPSFQLSFIAVLALISGFEFYVARREYFDEIFSGIFTRAIIFNIYSTILASIATIPLVIYHFHIVSNYVILSNLVIVPLVSFIIMPLGILSVSLSALGLDIYLYPLLEYSINLVEKIATLIANLPGSVWYFGHISHVYLLLYLLGLVWIIIWQVRIRYLGFALMLLSFSLMVALPRPDNVINKELGYKAFVNEDSDLEIIGDNISKFHLEYISHYFGYEKAIYTNKPIE